MQGKHKSTKTNSETNFENFAEWLVILMGKAILQQQFRNSAYSPTKEAKREVLELWTKQSAVMGRGRFTEGLMEAFLHTTFIPSCADIEQWAPEEPSENQMYRPFQRIEAPKDPVTQEQLDRFNAKVREICEGKIAVVKKEPKSQELQEVQSKGIKARVVDGKAEAANDK